MKKFLFFLAKVLLLASCIQKEQINVSEIKSVEELIVEDGNNQNEFAKVKGIDQAKDHKYTKTHDSLLIKTQDFPLYVKVEIQKFAVRENCDYCEDAPISYDIKDYNDNILYSRVLLEQENLISDEWGDVTPISKYFDGIGNVLILNEEWWPSLPSDYGSAVIIGQNTKGELVQVSPGIPLQEPAQNLNVRSFIKSKNGYEKSIICDTCIKMIETRYSTTYGGISYGLFFPLDIDGDFNKKDIEIKNSPIYSIDSNVNKLDSGDFTCYVYPDLNTDIKPIVVTVNSSSKINLINFTFKEKPNPYSYQEQMPLYVEIDGFKGYVREWGDFLLNLGHWPAG